MDEIHSDDGRTEEDLGRDPWLHTDWQGLFKRVAGSSEPPLQLNTLALAVGNRYGCDRGFGETIIRKAAECGQLLRIRVRLEGLTWDYYAADPDVVSAPSNRIFISDDEILSDTDSLAPKAVSRDELMKQMSSGSGQVSLNHIQYIADNIEHLTPFYIDDGDLKLHPQVSRQILIRRSHAQITEVTSFSTPTQVNEALAEVMEVVSEYKTAKDELHLG